MSNCVIRSRLFWPVTQVIIRPEDKHLAVHAATATKIVIDGWQVAHPVLNEGKMAGTHANKEGPQWVSFSGPGIPLIWSSDSGFESKIGASLGIESMFGRWDSKNNPRDYAIAWWRRTKRSFSLVPNLCCVWNFFDWRFKIFWRLTKWEIVEPRD